MHALNRKSDRYANNPDFLHTVLIENCLRMRPIIITVMVIEGLIFVFEFIFYPRTPEMIAAMALKLTAVMIGAVSVYFLRRIRLADDPGTDFRNLTILYACIGCCLAWAVANTIVAQLITGDITVYVLVLFGVAAVIQMPPKHAAVIYILAYVAFITSIPMVQDNTRILTWHIINGGVLNVIAWLISRMIYRYRLQIYRDKRIIDQKNKELFDKAQRDSLTGLLNHQAIHGHLEKSVNQTAGHGKELSVALIDIDKFKEINDTYGHQTGDTVVEQVAVTIGRSIRDMDVAGRYGGDEFMIVFPDCTLGNARRIVERLQRALSRMDGRMPSLTISSGIVQRTDENARKLVETADRLLYRAKALGRNRIES
jgi:diguanylate cyclase (GGDEF)-like protein